MTKDKPSLSMYLPVKTVVQGFNSRFDCVGGREPKAFDVFV